MKGSVIGSPSSNNVVIQVQDSHLNSRLEFLGSPLTLMTSRSPSFDFGSGFSGQKHNRQLASNWQRPPQTYSAEYAWDPHPRSSRKARHRRAIARHVRPRALRLKARHIQSFHEE